MAALTVADLSPTSAGSGGSPTYVVVWEWESKPSSSNSQNLDGSPPSAANSSSVRRWRPYTPEVTQLLERGHAKKLNKIYLADADPLLSDYHVDLTAFEQRCEPTGAVYAVRREFYSGTSSPAGKGARWEWGGGAVGGGGRQGEMGSPERRNDDWHVYDMEVQEVIEETWSKGDQTLDISAHFPGWPYIVNFCNLTQIKSTNGIVRPIRRVAQPLYPAVRLTQAEVAAMIHRKEARKMELTLVAEKRKLVAMAKKSKKSRDPGKMLETTTEKVKAVKQLVNQIFHHNSSNKHKESSHNTDGGTNKTFLRKRSSSSSGGRPLSGPAGMNARGPGSSLSASSNNIDSAGRYQDMEDSLSKANHRRQLSAPFGHNTLGTSERLAMMRMRQQQQQQQQQVDAGSPGRFIGHPSASEFAYPVVGRRGANRPGPSNLPGRHMMQHNRHYRRMPDSSFSSFSDAGSGSFLANGSNGNIVRRPSVDTISTYLSHESAQQQFYRRHYGNNNGNGSSPANLGSRSRGNSYGNYGGSLGSQELLDVYGGDADSVFTDDSYSDGGIKLGDSVSVVSGGNNSSRVSRHSHGRSMSSQQHRNPVVPMPMPPPSIIPPLRGAEAYNFQRDTRRQNSNPARSRILSDPELSSHFRTDRLPLNAATSSPSSPLRGTEYVNLPSINGHDNNEDDDDEGGGLYMNQIDLRDDIMSSGGGGYRYAYAGSPPPSASQHSLDRQRSQAAVFSNSRRALFQSQNSISGAEHSRDPSAISSNGYASQLSMDELSLSVQGPNPGGGSQQRLALTQSPMSSASNKNSPTKKRPVPTPRSVLNTSQSETMSQASSTANTVICRQAPVQQVQQPVQQVEQPVQQVQQQQYSAVDRLVLRFAQFVIDPPLPGEDCKVCRITLDQPSPCSDSLEDGSMTVVCLALCQHKTHLACLKSMIENQPEGPYYIKCPKCDTVLGEKRGDQPGTGNMSYKVLPKGLPGYENYHTIQITYSFNSGVQSGIHPLPGQPYYAVGFPRVAFLPDTEKGRRAVKLLEKAFERRLVFTIGMDDVTGQADVVSWSDCIEHKTEFASTTDKNLGYPDPAYLQRLFDQLATLGVVEELEHDV